MKFETTQDLSISNKFYVHSPFSKKTYTIIINKKQTTIDGEYLHEKKDPTFTFFKEDDHLEKATQYLIKDIQESNEIETVILPKLQNLTIFN